jgi:hypothetical protein
MARSNNTSTLLASGILVLLAAAMLLACARPAHAGRALSATPCDYSQNAADLAAKYCTEGVVFDCSGACTSSGTLLTSYCTRICNAALAAAQKAQTQLDCAALANKIAAILCPAVGK